MRISCFALRFGTAGTIPFSQPTIIHNHFKILFENETERALLL